MDNLEPNLHLGDAGSVQQAIPTPETMSYVRRSCGFDIRLPPDSIDHMSLKQIIQIIKIIDASALKDLDYQVNKSIVCPAV